MINPLFLQENERSPSYREINQHPSLPWNFIIIPMDFWTPPRFLIDAQIAIRNRTAISNVSRGLDWESAKLESTAQKGVPAIDA